MPPDRISGAFWKNEEGHEIYLRDDGMFEIQVGRKIKRGRDVQKLLSDLRRDDTGVRAMRIGKHLPGEVKIIEVVNVTQPGGRNYLRYRVKDGTTLDVSYSEDVYLYDPALQQELEAIRAEYRAVLGRFNRVLERLLPLTVDRFAAARDTTRAEEQSAEG